MTTSKKGKTQATSQKGKTSAAKDRRARAREEKANDLALKDDLRNALHDLGERIIGILEHPATPAYVHKALMNAVKEMGNNMPECTTDPQHVRWVMHSII